MFNVKTKPHAVDIHNNYFDFAWLEGGHYALHVDKSIYIREAELEQACSEAAAALHRLHKLLAEDHRQRYSGLEGEG